MSSSHSSRMVKTIGAQAAAQTIALRAQVSLVKLRSMAPMRNEKDKTAVVKLLDTMTTRDNNVKRSYASSNQNDRHYHQIKPAVPSSSRSSRSSSVSSRTAQGQGLGQKTSTKRKNGTTKRSKRTMASTADMENISAPLFLGNSTKRGARDGHNAATVGTSSVDPATRLSSNHADFHPAHASEVELVGVVGMERMRDMIVSDHMDSPKRRRLTPQSPPTPTATACTTENDFSATSTSLLCVSIPPHDVLSSHNPPSQMMSSHPPHQPPQSQHQSQSQLQYGSTDENHGVDEPLHHHITGSTTANKIKKGGKKSTVVNKSSEEKTGNGGGMIKMVGVKRSNVMVTASSHLLTRNGRKEHGKKIRQSKTTTNTINPKNDQHHPLSLTMTAATAATVASVVLSQSQRRKEFDQAWRARNHFRVASCRSSTHMNNRNSQNNRDNKSGTNDRRSSRLEAVTVMDLCSLLDDSTLGAFQSFLLSLYNI